MFSNSGGGETKVGDEVDGGADRSRHQDGVGRDAPRKDVRHSLPSFETLHPLSIS